MRSGFIHIVDGRLKVAGVSSNDWSSIASSKHREGGIYPSAYYLTFNAAGADPSGGPYGRWYGNPLSWL